MAQGIRIWIIYRIICIRTDRAYIGLTSSPMERRWSCHCSAAKKNPGKSLLHQAIREYGRDNFTMEIIYVTFSLEDAAAAERICIAEHGTMSPLGYNLTSGGEGTIGIVKSAITISRLSASGKGIPRPRSPEHQAKLTAARKGYRPTPETRERQRLAHLGKSLSEEHKAKISAAHKGRKLSDKELANLEWKGRKHSEATKAKISAIKQGMKYGPMSDETKKKISAANKGKHRGPSAPFSAERKARISAALTGRPLSEGHKISIALGAPRTGKILASSGYRGVKKHGRGWSASIRIGKKLVYLGTFDTAELASLAYQSALAGHIASLRAKLIE